ncbi:ABC transporter ATP-binding protein [Mycoplasmopsis phocirhinis]|uniref:ABC transporter ATP-binding protein n=1 Tax=Mycoplasmopsis phocirhinis TaxID=142650 RepID=A0A4P6MP17_9BACT|nr:ABC transporter ATP-binding protein [Mycoplasmopsis phocirhinis]QBF34436.1 ABC transporter ATP-binding protein [Mycoplasmopsis phocirhinis]
MNINKSKRKFGSTFGIIKLVSKYSGRSPWLFVFGIFTTIINSLAYVGGIMLGGILASKAFTPQALLPGAAFDDTFFISMIIAMSVVFLIFGIFRFLEFKIYLILGFSTAMNMRRIAMQKLLKMPVSYFDKHKSGDLISTLINDVNNISLALSQILTQAFSNVAHLIITITSMIIYSANITIIVILITLLLFSVGFVMIKKARPNVERVWDGFGKLNAFVEEGVKNMKITKTFGRREESTKSFNVIAKDIYQNAFRADLWTQMFIPWFIMSTNIIILVAAAIIVVFKNNNTPLWSLLQTLGLNSNGPDLGFFLAYIGYIHNVTGALQSIIGTIFGSQNGVVSTARINEIAQLIEPNISNEVNELNDVKGHIKFENVWFRYNNNKQEWHLKNASFEALPGQSIALVGPTGAGKTTVINLLSKFHDYQKGSITIDGVELKTIKKQSLNQCMAVVLQDSFMFKDTVYNNILIGNKNASEHTIYDSTKLVSAHQTILRLQNGYNTMLEDNDLVLSKGEKQLLAISRAVLGDKKILILDEATSNIDTNTEKIIQDALANSIMKNKTSIVIAHRLSTIKNADLILFVEDGEIIERGTHQQLIAQDGKYAALYKSQFA